MNKILAISILLFVCYSSKAQDDKWLYAGSSKQKDKVYIRSEYVSKENGKIYIWTKWKVPKQVINKITYLNVEIKEFVGVECETKKMTTKKSIIYSSSGKVIKSYDDYENWQDIIPDSMEEVILNTICEVFNQ